VQDFDPRDVGRTPVSVSLLPIFEFLGLLLTSRHFNFPLVSASFVSIFQPWALMPKPLTDSKWNIWQIQTVSLRRPVTPSGSGKWPH
jgi:hypothetical protein